MRIAWIYGAFGASFFVLLGAWSMMFDIEAPVQKVEKPADRRVRTAPDHYLRQKERQSGTFPVSSVRRRGTPQPKSASETSNDLATNSRVQDPAIHDDGAFDGSRLLEKVELAGCSKVINDIPVEVEIMQALGIEGDDVRVGIRRLVKDYRETYDSLVVEYREGFKTFMVFKEKDDWSQYPETSGAQHLQSQLDLARERFVIALSTLTLHNPRAEKMTSYLPLRLN